MAPNWRGILETTNRHLIRGLIAVFTAIVLLLLQSAFWSARVSSWMHVVIVAMALISYFRPQYGLLALAALAPLGQVGSRTLDSQMRGAEALVLAFLAGALVRGWTLREFRSFPATRLETAALIFGLVVAASCAEQLWFLQIQHDYPWPFIQSVMTYARRGYVVTFGGTYGMIFHAMLLLEGVALLVFTLKYAQESPEFPHRLVTMLVVGAVGTALLTFQDIATELAQTEEMRARLLELVAHRRWSTHVADVNAAGSFFAMAMFIAFGLAVKDRAFAWAWIAAGIALAVAMTLTQSRTAIVVVMLMTACVVAASTIGRVIGAGKAVAVAAVAFVVLAVTLWNRLPREFIGTGAIAVEIRWLFLGTTWRMLMANPLFGVGVGQIPVMVVPFRCAGIVEVVPKRKRSQQLRPDCGRAWRRRAHHVYGSDCPRPAVATRHVNGQRSRHRSRDCRPGGLCPVMARWPSSPCAGSGISVLADARSCDHRISRDIGSRLQEHPGRHRSRSSGHVDSVEGASEVTNCRLLAGHLWTLGETPDDVTRTVFRTCRYKARGRTSALAYFKRRTAGSSRRGRGWSGWASGRHYRTRVAHRQHRITGRFIAPIPPDRASRPACGNHGS